MIAKLFLYIFRENIQKVSNLITNMNKHDCDKGEIIKMVCSRIQSQNMIYLNFSHNGNGVSALLPYISGAYCEQ